jgi:hypothetical protein
MPYVPIARRAHVTATTFGGGLDVSQAIDVRGYNAVKFDVVVLRAPTNDVSIGVYGSADLENWSLVTSLGQFSEGFSMPATVTSIKASYLRLQYVVVEDGMAIVAVGANISTL